MPHASKSWEKTAVGKRKDSVSSEVDPVGIFSFKLLSFPRQCYFFVTPCLFLLLFLLSVKFLGEQSIICFPPVSTDALLTLQQGISALMADGKFDLKLITEFDGSDRGLTFIE